MRTISAYDLISDMPLEHQAVASLAYEVLRKDAPSEDYETGRADAMLEVLRFFGVAAPERLVARWSCEGVPA